MKIQIGFIGLGRMGKAMVLHMLEKGINVVVYNRTQQKTDELVSEFRISKSKFLNKSQFQNSKYQKRIPQPTTHNPQLIGKLIPSYSIKELVEKLEAQPKIIWLMVEHGKPVDIVINQLLESGLQKNDIIIDGGNSFYKDSMRRFGELEAKDIHFLDIGTSGGLEGARKGACVMVGGEEKVFNSVKPILQKISVPGGVAYFGPSGAGHFIKMTHNGVEYGMLQAIGEGFEILEKGPYKLDLHKVADNWSHGSVVRGWLMELLEQALKQKSKVKSQKSKVGMNNFEWLDEFSGSVGGGSTGEWTGKTADELGVEAPILKGSYEARLKSKNKPTFAGKVISALRFQFGGHRD